MSVRTCQVLGLRRSKTPLAITRCPVLPSRHPTSSASGIWCFRSSIARLCFPLLTLPHDLTVHRGICLCGHADRKLAAQMDRYPFLIRLFHSLLYAGFNRRFLGVHLFIIRPTDQGFLVLGLGLLDGGAFALGGARRSRGLTGLQADCVSLFHRAIQNGSKACSLSWSH
jgi:hypothetical protein